MYMYIRDLPDCPVPRFLADVRADNCVTCQNDVNQADVYIAECALFVT
jgi:hypothetical protein